MLSTNLKFHGLGDPIANPMLLRMEDPSANPELQNNVDEEEWFEFNQEMPKPRMKEFSSHYGGNKFRTTQRIVKPSSSSPTVKDILVGFELSNLSVGVGEVPPMVTVSIVKGELFTRSNNIHHFSAHSLALS